MQDIFNAYDDDNDDDDDDNNDNNYDCSSFAGWYVKWKDLIITCRDRRVTSNVCVNADCTEAGIWSEAFKSRNLFLIFIHS